MGSYEKAYQRSMEDPKGFWLQAAELIDWTTAPSVALDVSNSPFYRWSPTGSSARARTPWTGTSVRAKSSAWRWPGWGSARATESSFTYRWFPRP